jgi:integrase/recombinase XerD
MPRKSGEAGNLYKRGGTWYARIQVRGHDIRRSLRTGSKTEAQKRLAVVLKEADHYRFHGEARHTWKEAVVEWAKQASTDINPSTIKRYLVSLGQVRGILDGLHVDEISSRTVSQIARRPGVTNATRRRDLTAVSVVLRFCEAHGWREGNPVRAWDRGVLRERRDPIVLPGEKDIAAIVALAPGNLARMILWAQYTGMREEECASLERQQIDMRRRAAHLTRTKTNRPREVPLDERALSILAQIPAHLHCPFAFWHEPGERYRNVSSRFAAISRRAGASIRRFRFHDLRHWFAVDYLRRGGSIYSLQKILGHSSIRTTEIYLDFLTPDEQEQAKRTG